MNAATTLSLRKQGVRLGLWILAALALSWPLALHLRTELLGDPRVDVWNHAWGYWYVLDALTKGQLPWQTDLVGGPAGGVLYFIDTPGALAMLPVSWLLGPAAGYNLALILRVALTGLAAQLLAEEVAGPPAPEGTPAGPRLAGWLAGLTAITMPFLLCELANGIGEVCATQWLIFTIWATLRAQRRGGLRSWLLVGTLQGITSVVTFYYGLASAIAVACLVIMDLAAMVWRRRTKAADGPPRPSLTQKLLHISSAALPALALMLPHWLVFRASLSDASALIRRDESLNLQLMAHNAVDPRVFVIPGHFQSVDLAAIYGEPFIHTGYLRLSVLALALVALVLLPRTRRLGVVIAVSLLASLGPFLWWGGDWVHVGGMVLSLPFEWIRQVLPQVAITHPLRLGLAAQTLTCVLAALGAAALLKRLSTPLFPLAAAVLGLLMVGEGLFLSAAQWPLPRSSAAVPNIYQDAPPGMVLDLPAEVGTTMETSRYFWFQTVHGRPIPYTTDVRMGSARDALTFAAFQGRPAPGDTFFREHPSTPGRRAAAHIKDTYGLVVVHRELARRAGLEGAYEAALEPALGPPQVIGDLSVWRPQGDGGRLSP